MNKQHSWTRQQYEHCYRMMRRETEGLIGLTFVGIHNDIIRAADYSYQAKDYDVHGWSNDQSRKRFHAIIWRVGVKYEDIPS